MVQKSTQQTVKVPIKLCSQTFADLEEVYSEYTLTQVDPSRHYFQYRKGMKFSSYPITVQVGLRNLDHRRTEINILAEMFGLADPLGVLTASINQCIQSFDKQVEIERRRSKPEIDSGKLCPACYSPIPPGARFCSNDGTPVASQCPQCNHSNPLGAKFCSSCGNPLS